MLFGIDFDNTIACYDESFLKISNEIGVDIKKGNNPKKYLKKFLIERDKCEESWQKVQGLVYGKYINFAYPYPGVYKFIRRVLKKGHRVVIISHKTEYGHFDKHRINLRIAALDWLKENLFKATNVGRVIQIPVYFANSRAEKVALIESLGCDIYIDDLLEVFEDSGFPSDVYAILFGWDSVGHERINFASSSWADIGDTLLGIESEDELREDASLLLGRSIHYFKRLDGGGNSRAYKVVDEKGNLFFLKQYPDLSKDIRKRQHIEFSACNFFKKHDIKNVAHVEHLSKELNITLFKWIEGDAIKVINQRHIDMAVYFVQLLNKLSKNTTEETFQSASEACLSLSVLKSQIDLRASQLFKISSEFPNLNLFLNEHFMPLKKKIYDWLEAHHQLETTNFDYEVREKILSPGDFGFHNAIIQNNKISWIDFEYFGWDDPVKLVAEFIIHPAMNFNENQKIYWISRMIQIFDKVDSDFKHRLNVSWPLYILRWSLIILNVYSDKFKDKGSLIKKVNYSCETIKMERQLLKANNILSQLIKKSYDCPYILD